MSQAVKKIKQKLGAFTEKDAVLRSGTVACVDEGTYTAVVKLTGFESVPVEGVMLSAISDDQKGLIPIPAVGSNVVVGTLDGGGEYFIVRTSQLDKIIANIGDSSYLLTQDGYKLSRGDESLTKLLKDLLNAILKATYTNGAGTTSPANNLSDFQDVLTRIDKLLI